MARTDSLGHFLTDVADAIRTKGGTSADIQASSFDTAIANLPGGGGATEVEEKDVNFYDYDGTRLHSYTKAEFLALDSMPNNPSHEGLTSQGWSYTLQEAKNVVTEWGMLDIGHYFVTNDGATRIYIDLSNGIALSPYLGFCLNGTATIDWGDNTSEVVTGTDITTILKFPHTYSTNGKYVISISGGTILFKSSSISNDPSLILSPNELTSRYGLNVYAQTIYKVEIGNNMSKFGDYAFYRLYCLKIVTTPLNITEFSSNNIFTASGLSYYVVPKIDTMSTNCFVSCYSLKNVTFSSITTEAGGFSNCYALKRVTIPFSSLTKGSTFSGCYSLMTAILDGNGTTIQTAYFGQCSSLTSIVIPATITRIRTGVFAQCYSLKKVDFTKLTAVPTLDNVNTFSNIPDDCKFVVPDDLYNSWITANNWSSLTSHIVKESDY